MTDAARWRLRAAAVGQLLGAHRQYEVAPATTDAVRRPLCAPLNASF